MRMTFETLKVLNIFLENLNEPQYGLEITKATGVQAGTLYPILMRLETNKWLSSDWEDIDPVKEGRRARRYYTITDLGKREAIKAQREIFQPKLGVSHA
jgi:PadR family transcriptional regulator, regulatory protein PadR